MFHLDFQIEEFISKHQLKIAVYWHFLVMGVSKAMEMGGFLTNRYLGYSQQNPSISDVNSPRTITI